MMAKVVKKRKMSIVAKIRVFFTVIIILVVVSTLGYNCVCNILKIIDMKNQKVNLQEKIVKLDEEKEELELDIRKLEDPDYIAKYVREKYLYSKDGEIILRLN